MTKQDIGGFMLFKIIKKTKSVKNLVDEKLLGKNITRSAIPNRKPMQQKLDSGKAVAFECRVRQFTE